MSQDQEAPVKLYPLFHICGAICLYSTVPIKSGRRVPHWRYLRLADGITPLWSNVRGQLALRAHPAEPDCPRAGDNGYVFVDRVPDSTFLDLHHLWTTIRMSPQTLRTLAPSIAASDGALARLP